MAEAIISPGVFQREQDITFRAPQPIEGGAAILGPAVKGPVEIPTYISSYRDYQNKFGDVFTSGSTEQEFITSIAVKNYFQQGGETILMTRIVNGTFEPATNTEIQTNGNVTGSEDPFEIETIGEGVIFNNSTGSDDPGLENSDGSLVSGSRDNIRWEVSNVNTERGTFTLSVRRGDDSANSKIILESYNDVSLDPNSTNYIEKRVGNQKKTLVPVDGGYIKTQGDFQNKSDFIRIKKVNSKTYNYLANDGTTVNQDTNGNSYSDLLPVTQSGSFYGAVGENQINNDFFEEIATSTQGLEGENYDDVINLLRNKDDYKFNIITAPGLIDQFHTSQIDSIISLAETRGDCIAVVDLVQHDSTVSDAAQAAKTRNTSYGAAYWPWVQMIGTTGRNVWVPASTVIPGVYAFTDNSAAPWFAPAGLTRGGVTGVVQPERKLNRPHRDELYAAKVNPIAIFPGQGINVYGQKTLQTKPSALDRVNVRRLLIELKDFIGKEARKLVFEQNTTATRNRFLARVNPYLEQVVQRQGLYAFRVIMDETVNTPDVVDRKQLVGKVAIQPTPSSEFIVIDFELTPTGADFSN